MNNPAQFFVFSFLSFLLFGYLIFIPLTASPVCYPRYILPSSSAGVTSSGTMQILVEIVSFQTVENGIGIPFGSKTRLGRTGHLEALYRAVRDLR
jgi:hypothetical protein